jgi:hypothetical protein
VGAGSAGGTLLFTRVFASWLDAVTRLALWRFWWCTVLLCMCVRISWLKEMGQYTPNSQWEMLMYTAFMVIIMYVPFNPFAFRPGEMVAGMLEKAGQAAKNGKGNDTNKSGNTSDTNKGSDTNRGSAPDKTPSKPSSDTGRNDTPPPPRTTSSPPGPPVIQL